VVSDSLGHWQQCADAMLASYRQSPEHCREAIEALEARLTLGNS